jgi:sigma-B regulation protein RsbU (phosphoserine phosphatase)
MGLTFLISLIYLVSAIVLFIIAGIILRENVKSAQNRVVSAMLFLAGLAPFLVAIYKTVIFESTTLSESALNVFYIWELFFPTLLLFSMIFPEVLPFYKKHRRLLQVAFIPHIFHIILVVALNAPDTIIGILEFDTSMPVIGWILAYINALFRLLASFLGYLLTFHTKFFSLINFAYVLLSVYFLVLGYSGVVNPALRTQVKVVIAGIVAAVGLYVIAFIIPTILSIRLPYGLREIMILTALIVGPGSIAWAIIKFRFLDIGLIARQSLVYTITTAIVVGGYLLVITQLSTLFTSIFGYGSRILDVLVVIILLLFFQPIYNQVDDFVRRIFIRSRSDYRHLMEEFSKQLITVFDINRLTTIVGDTLNREMFIEKTNFALRLGSGDFYRFMGDSREYTIEKGIHDQLIDKQKPVFLNGLKGLTREGYLGGRLVELGGHLVVPLIDNKELVGVVFLSQKIAGFRYTYEDLTLLSVVANQVVVALNNSRLYLESLAKQRLEEELAVARQIQQNLLPQTLPIYENYEFAAFNHPSHQVGGDYYDFINVSDRSVGVVVADVSGKGVPAALLMARLQAVLQSEGQRGRPIEDMLSWINELLVSSTSPDKFVTMFYGELDCDSGSICFCNAGHNIPFIITKNGDIEYLEEGGLILGAFAGTTYKTSKLELYKDDVLVIYTDGLSEAMNEYEEEYGEQRLIEAAREARSRSAQFICGHLIKNVRQFASESTEVDDMTLVVVKAK